MASLLYSLKNEYNLEDVRVRSYVAIRNVVAILHTVFYLLSVEFGIRLAFSIVFKKVMEKAKRFFEVTIFKQYVLAEWLGCMLFETIVAGYASERQKTRPTNDPKILTINTDLKVA